MKVKIETLNKEIEIKKLPLKKYSDLLKGLQKLFPQLMEMKDVEVSTIFSLLPTIIENSFDDVCELIVMATELKKEETEALALDEFIDIIITLYEVNRYKEVYDRIKKVQAQPTEPIQIG